MTSSFRSLLIAALVCPLAALAQQASPTLEPESPARNYKNELHMGDLAGNAFTLRSGTFMLHPIWPTGFGITDNVEVKTSMLGLLGGPNVALEYGILSGDDTALSIEPSISSIWSFQGFSGGATARFSQRVGASNFFNVNAGANYTQVAPVGTNPATAFLSVPVGISFDIQSSPHTIWDFRAGTDVMALMGPIPYGTVGFAWYHSFGGSFQLGLGLDLIVGRIPNELVQLAQIANITLPALAVIPMPDITFGWKF